MIRHRQINLHRFKDGFEKALRLPPRKSVNGLDCGHRLNRQVRVNRRSSRLSGQLAGRPIGERVFADPDGQTSTLFEAAVIF